MEVDVPKFRLSCSLAGHTGDIKAVTEAGAGRLVTGSRDLSVRVWQAADGKNYLQTGLIQSHQRYVNTVAFAPPSTEFPEGLIISGGLDNAIFVFSPDNLLRPVWTLIGHTNNISAVAFFRDPTTLTPLVLSGSWDMTARVWDLTTGANIATLQGHTKAVWSVIPLESGDILTGSADKTIKLWHGNNCIRTFEGHTDCVRALAVIPGIGFISASNDSTLRVWSLDGESLQELIGHTAYVYSVAFLPSTGEIISGGEDRTARVWSDGSCVQSILHPADSVWSVAALSNGDIVTGTNDGVGRVFTRHPDRVAADEALAAFDEQIKAHSIPVESINPDQLSTADSLSQPGRKDEEVKMVNNNGVVEAYQWSAAQGQWIKVGEVTNVRKESKKLFNGMQYDYVFDVDVGDGLPARKLPYNVSENPYTAAQQFLHREELSQEFLDSVAKFIMQNAQGAGLTAAPAAAADPYTGTSRYSGGAPMTGGGQPQSTTSAANPFAGAYTTAAVSSSQTTAPAPTTTTAAGLLPQRGYVSFDKGNFAAIHSKIQQLNTELQTSNASLAFNKEELESLASLVDTLSNTSRYHATSIFPNQFAVLAKGLHWPSDKRFPVLDLLRLIIVHPSTADHFKNLPSVSEQSRLVQYALVGGQVNEGSSGSEINHMFALRALANLCNTSAGRYLVIQSLEQITTALTMIPTSGTNKNFHQALSTLYLNLAVLLSGEASAARASELLVAIILQELSNQSIEEDAAYNLLLAVGTLAFTKETVRATAKQHGVASHARVWQTRGKERINALVPELLRLLQ